jgi:potassium/hydrogen antiporter
VFAALGLTIDVQGLDDQDIWLDGLLFALVLAFVARPLVVALLLAPVRLTVGERVFIAWSGLKGAVPILLGTFVVLSEIEEDQRIYGIVFVVVAFSVLVQGSLVPHVAGLCRVPMHQRPLTPWDVSVRLEREPHGLQHFVVAPGSEAEGRAVRDLPIGESTWLTLVVHDGEAVQPRGAYVLQASDEVLVLSEPADEDALRHLFEGE